MGGSGKGETQGKQSPMKAVRSRYLAAEGWHRYRNTGNRAQVDHTPSIASLGTFLQCSSGNTMAGGWVRAFVLDNP